LPQTDSSVCSAPGHVIRFRQLTALLSGNASTNRGAANLEVHATPQLGAVTLPPKSSATIGKDLTMQVLTVEALNLVPEFFAAFDTNREPISC